MKPTVGRIVHFYSTAQRETPTGNPRWNGQGHNGQGDGPYVAIVVQAFSDDYANLWVFDPFSEAPGGGHYEGSVSEKGQPHAESRYWCWPPLGTPSGPS